MLHGHLDVPTFAYFDFKNIWTGSVFDEFNYKIYPYSGEEKNKLKTIIWYGRKSIDSITEEDYEKVLFHDLTPEGYDKLLADINALVDEYVKKFGVKKRQ